MKKEEKESKPDWLETLFNVNPRLAERAEEYIEGILAERAEKLTTNIPYLLGQMAAL